MAARPAFGIVRQLLRSNARGCSSGAPVTQPRPGEPSRPTREASIACPRRVCP
uniref:Molybdenum cofactor synthesis 1 n=1 Tax=Mus musculus TaxID=10090 RepID=G3UXJ3_MOUSE